MIEAILKDVVVLELANVLAGPSVGMFLAEAGATVIKIENIKGGDVTRSWKLPSEAVDTDISAYFSACNWGKKSIALDLTKAEGQKILTDLVSKADIILTSYKPGDAQKLGVDYFQLKKIKNDLIYAQLTGYGSDDKRVGYDAIIQAESGFMSMNGTEKSGPLKMPVALMDILAAHQLKEAVLLALLKKFKTGEGSFIESSLIETGIASLANQATNWLNGGVVPDKIGSAHPNIMPYGNTYLTKDKRIILLAVGSDAQFERLWNILNISHIKKGQFETNHQRVKNRKELDDVLSAAIAEMNSDELLEKLSEAAVPAGAVLDVNELFETRYAKDLLLSQDRIKGVRTAAFNLEKLELAAPPHFGEHTSEILLSFLNYSEKEIASLRKENVIK